MSMCLSLIILDVLLPYVIWLVIIITKTKKIKIFKKITMIPNITDLMKIKSIVEKSSQEKLL